MTDANLIEIFCILDEFCKYFAPELKKRTLDTSGKRRRRRPCRMSDSEVMTILVLFHTMHHRDLKSFYLGYICNHMRREFPNRLSYNRFVERQAKVGLQLLLFLQICALGKCTGISIIDSTPIVSCHIKRAHSHKTMKGWAAKGKSTMGWFYGFKLHIVINDRGEIIQWMLTPGNTDDREPLKDKDGTRGFFYRDKSRKSIVHYIHQSREQVYMQAMVMLCETQKEHPDYPKWVNSIQLYGEYLKGMMKYTHPYGMIPSGVYHAEEYKDTTNFYALHLFPPANAKELYTEQIKRGVQLDKEHYMKRFPVWFNIFNGNTAIHLSNGKSAAICGNFLKDKELLNIGLEQLYWTVGKNPFGQSLIYGEGHNYPQLNTFSSGEMTGEMPVGIRTLGNDDVPYWPQTNNACYKEVWITSEGKWMSLIAEY